MDAAAETVYLFHPVATAGVAKSAPAEVAMTFDPSEVIRIEIRVPAGVNGLSGIAIAQAHQPIIPRNSGAFIVTNDELISWAISGFANTGSWSAFLYNTDAFDHTYEVRFLCQLIGSAQASSLMPITPINLATVA